MSAFLTALAVSFAVIFVAELGDKSQLMAMTFIVVLAISAAAALLLEAGADPNDDTGGDCPETPLHWAASSDDADVAAVLIDGGADQPDASR